MSTLMTKITVAGRGEYALRIYRTTSGAWRVETKGMDGLIYDQPCESRADGVRRGMAAVAAHVDGIEGDEASKPWSPLGEARDALRDEWNRKSMWPDTAWGECNRANAFEDFVISQLARIRAGRGVKG